jgi:formyltetrahydrofolate-dependent phosphoribosylglycinamide formyltransferase
MTRPIRLAALISGGGTTLQNFIDRIASGEMSAEIAVVISSNPKAYGLDRARAAGIPSAVVERKRGQSVEEFSRANFDVIRKHAPNLVCLAGYLKFLRIPDDYAGRVMNIHPALIPAFCGHGYYGHAVHQAAIDYGVKVSGCTVHFVNNEYDAGPIIIQRTVPVLEGDTADTLAARVFREECIAYPLAIRLFQSGRLKIAGRKVLIT